MVVVTDYDLQVKNDHVIYWYVKLAYKIHLEVYRKKRSQKLLNLPAPSLLAQQIGRLSQVYYCSILH